jgi:cytochrome P450
MKLRNGNTQKTRKSGLIGPSIFSLPYTEATIMEVMRIATVLPIGVFHNTMRDVEFHGYKIPRDTMVLTNLYAVHHGNHWWQPEVFDSVRFLSPDRSRVEKPAAFMPFGTGKRACLGETLARDQLFLILAAILQSFKVSLDPAGGRPSLLPMPMSPISSPQPHKVVFSLRQC